MGEVVGIEGRHPLSHHGIVNPGRAYWNIAGARLFEEALHRGEGLAAANGPLVVKTGKFTGRSPNDRFIVQEASSDKHVHWGKVNRPFIEAKFHLLRNRVTAYLQGRDIFVRDCWAGADPEYRLPIRVITEKAWQNLFAHHLFIKADSAQLETHQPEFTIIAVPGFQADPERDGTASEAFIIVNFLERLVLIGGTHYAGEIKKSIFGVLNYLLPLKGVLSMHASANIGKDGKTSVFFGLSGTGKTTLSADPERTLIGDDEHGWSDRGVFNFEGGCYAKMIRLSREAEPEIYSTTQRFGTILENVVMDEHSRELDLNDEALTENTRGAYPLEFIPNASATGTGGHPTDIVMLTADAFGVLPPISRLTTEQAMYHFLSGYTAKVAGTERGVTEPQATFSTCFGAPFMVLAPGVYAKLLGEKILEHKTRVWLLNTGWSGGPYGVGSRMKISYTRAMLHAAIDGKLDGVGFQKEPFFNLQIPASCPGVPAEVLDPRKTWKDQAAYDRKAKDLAGRFVANFKQFEADTTPEIRASGPQAQE